MFLRHRSTPAKPPLKPLVVVGSVNADIYVEVDRLPKPGETLAAGSGYTLPGGKGANQAACAAKLGYPTYFVGQVRIGTLHFGSSVHLLKKPFSHHLPTISETRSVQLIRTRAGATSEGVSDLQV